MVTFWSSSTYNPHINNSGQDSLTKNILSSSFDPDLWLARTELLHNILKTTAVLFAIKTTKQSHIKSCLRWLPATLDQSQVMLSSLSHSANHNKFLKDFLRTCHQSLKKLAFHPCHPIRHATGKSFSTFK